MDVKGADVSMYQPVVNYGEMVSTGQSFLYIKGTEGATYVDPLCDKHVKGSFQVALACGLYHFYHPTRSPEDQADNFCKLWTRYKSAFLLPPVVDIETTDEIRDENRALKRAGVSSAKIRDDLRKYCLTVESRLGRPVTLYTYPGFANLHDLGQALGASQPLWIAHYGVKVPTVPRGWPRATLWQSTGSGRIHPIAGGSQNADLDVFLGSQEEFLKWTKNL
jgi:lysozyme